MIFGVVVVHTPPYAPYGAVPNEWFPLLVAFFQNGFFRATVPVLTLISGYCLFKSGLDTNFRKLIAKKARTLLLPFLIFNLGMLLIDVLADRFFGASIVYDRAAMQDARAWLTSMFGIFGYPINLPLYFLRDLMVLILLTPLFGWVLRRTPFVGLAAVAVFFLSDLDGLLILRGDMPVMFYAGGIIALHQSNLRAIDRYAYPAFAAFVALCMYAVWFGDGSILVLRLVAPFLIWPISAVLVETSFGQWAVKQSRYSFFIFISHAPLLFGLWKLNKLAGAPVPVPVFTVVMPFVVVAILIALYKMAMRVMPGPFSLAIGGRSKTTVRVERRVAPALPGMWPVAMERRMAPR